VFLARPPREHGVSPVLLERADGPFRITWIERQQARLEYVDGSVPTFEQPVSVARLIRFPWMREEEEGDHLDELEVPQLMREESDSDFGDDNSPGAE
jgi:hypothetical protein